jgi:CHRD domain-containing protein
MKTMRSRINLPALIVSAAFAVIGASALAADIKVKLVGAEETPPTTSAATGAGTISIAADRSVSGKVTTQGIDGTVAHIHLGAVGQAGPPIITLDKGDGGVWSVPAGAKLTDDQFASFKAGNLYVNVHSAAHPAGEIRGQLKP